MDIANHLAVIEQLCAREFPSKHGRMDVGTGGPGYLTAELQTSGEFHQAGAAEEEETRTQYEADRDALGERLADRWGPADVFSLSSTFARAAQGEVDEPWATLASHVPDVHLWQAPTGRWVALGVSQWNTELPFQLVAVVTSMDPP